jgi:transposase-like protein
MSKMKAEPKAGRNRYSGEYKQQALARAERDGVPVAARDLRLEPSQLYAWRSQSQRTGQDAEALRLVQSGQARLRREVARLVEKLAILKNSGGVIREAAEVKHAAMKTHEGQFNVRLICRVPSGYCAWRVRKRSRRAQKRATMDALAQRGLCRQQGARGLAAAFVALGVAK